MASPNISGSILAMILFDVCEEIRLDELGEIGTTRVGQSFKHAAPQYVRFEHPPVIRRLRPVTLDSGEQLSAQIKFYDYGVVSVLMEKGFSGDWDELVKLAAAWATSPDFETRAGVIARDAVASAGSSMIKTYREWLVEDYFVVQVSEVSGASDASSLVHSKADEITQIVRGETVRLSDDERKEVLQSSISYYPNDLVVVGWHTAFLYDTPTGSRTAIELLEYANSQLLEFRHYDELLTRELDAVYRALDRKTGLLGGFRLARDSTRLQTVVLDVTELAERADNAIKFVGDMFAARLHRLAAAKVGVIDYEELVHEKLRIADELYRFMVEQFQHSRTFVLEVMVVIILIIELGFVFHGK